MKTFGSLIRTSFQAVSGWLLGGIGFALTIVSIAVGKDAVVPLWLVITTSVVLLIACITFYEAARTAWDMTGKLLPAVKQVMPPPASYHAIERLMLLEPSDMFVAGMMVSIYINEESYERFVGVGQVMTVQENRCIQVGLMKADELDPEIVDQIARGESIFLKRLVVRPSVPSFVLPG